MKYFPCVCLLLCSAACVDRAEFGTTVVQTVTIQPTSVPADGVATADIAIVALHADGTPVPNVPITLRSTAHWINITQPSPTDGQGTCKGHVSSPVAGQYTISAFVNVSTANAGVPATGSIVFTPLPPAPGTPSNITSIFVAEPNRVSSDGVTTTLLRLTLLDSQSNRVANAPVAFSSTGSNNVFSLVYGVTDVNGMLTTTLASSVAEVKTVTAQTSGEPITTQVTFSATAPSSALSTLTANPNTVIANGNSTTQVTFTLRDADGNPVPGQNVTFSSSGSTNVFSSTTGVTGALGTFTATLASTTLETKAITARSGDIVATTQVQFVTGPPDATTSTITASGPVVADGNATITLTTVVYDAMGDPLPNQTVTLSTTASGINFVPVTGTTNALGSFIATATSTTVGPATVVANLSGGVTTRVAISFFAGPADSTTSTLTSSRASIVADGVQTTTLTMTVKDAEGHPLPNQSVTLSGNGNANTFSATRGYTDASGVFTATLASTVVQPETITASVASFLKTADVTFVAGPANSGTSTLTASQNTIIANGSNTTLLTVTVQDRMGNPVIGQAVSLSVSGTGYMLTPANGNTNASGVLTATLSSTTAQTMTITATIGTFYEYTSVTFVPDAASAFTVTAMPASVPSGQATSITVTAIDAHGNQATGYTGTVHFSSSDATATLPADTTFTPSNAGVLSFTNGVILNTTGSQTINANDTSTPSIAGSVTIQVTSTVAAISHGPSAESTCVVFATGSIKCWGNNVAGSLGYGDTLSRGKSTSEMGGNLPFVNIGNGNTAVQVATSGLLPKYPVNPDASCALLENHNITCWGSNATGELGLGDTTNRLSPASLTNVNLGAGRTVQQLAMGALDTCVVLDTGAVECWGANLFGEDGLGDTKERNAPAGVTNLGTGRTALSISAAASTTCAVLDTSQLKCWGYNGSGDLGYGDTQARNSPPTATVNVGTGRSVLSVSMGDGNDNNSTCAMLDTQQIKCWGNNDVGELGYGDTLQRTTPPAATVNLGTGRTATFVDQGWDHTCALLDTGAVTCWGDNTYGELGLGNTTSQMAPAGTVNLGTGRTATDIRTAGWFTCALLDTGNVTCWGYNAHGELGLGDTVNRGTTSSNTPNNYAAVQFW